MTEWLRRAIFAGCLLAACGPVSGEPVGTTAEAICTEAYDWHDFPSGDQCVGGVDAFFQNHFSVSLPALCAYPSSGGCSSCGACEFWVANAPNPAQWDRVSSGPPQLYDMAVYPPPSSSNPYGHVAVVDHADSSGVYVMDDNYVGYLQKASCPHTVSWAPYGYYRLKSLEPPPPPMPARGSLDSVSCQQIAGWAEDPNKPGTAITVDLYADGPSDRGTPLGRYVAGASRSDLCGAIGSCDHGFTVQTPGQLYDGRAHSIYAYAIPATSGASSALLSGAPRTVHCAATLAGDFLGTGRAQLAEFRDDWLTIPRCSRSGASWSCVDEAATFVGAPAGAGGSGTGVYPGSVPLVADIDGDGRDDLVEFDSASTTIPVCFSRGGWSCESVAARYVGGMGAGTDGSGVYPGATPLVGDVNGDGRIDLIQFRGDWQSIPVCFATASGWACDNLEARYVAGLGAGNAGTGVYASSFGAGTTALVADVNGDGKADVVQFNRAWQTIPVCFSTGSGWACENTRADYVGGHRPGNAGSGVYDATSVLVADVNGDGLDDVVQYSPQSDAIPVCFSTGRGWSCKDLAATYVGGMGAGNAGSGVYPAANVLAADVNGDGRADLIQYASTWQSIPVCFSTREGWACENLKADGAGGPASRTGNGGSAVHALGFPVVGRFQGGPRADLLQVAPEAGWTTLPLCALDTTGWTCSNDAADVH